MKKPRFKNRPNDHITYNFKSESSGVEISHDFWVSRSVSVDGYVFAIDSDGKGYILVIKRSSKMVEDPGKYGVPCGYLDWDETTYDAIIREIYEETSLYLPDYNQSIIFDNHKEPFHIDSLPYAEHNKRQNIVFNYVFLLDFRDSDKEFPRDIVNYTSKETSKVLWMPWDDYLNNVYIDWSFNHSSQIIYAVMQLPDIHPELPFVIWKE